MTTFAELGLPLPIVKELTALGITSTFPIQQAAIPDALAGKDVLGRGPTGSGKTFSFGLPIIAQLSAAGFSRPGHPRALILVPTRELAAQVKERLTTIANAVGLRVIDVVGGINIKNHIRMLAAPVDILVATPGRAQDLVDHNHLFFSDVQITALDEADHMADMGFLPQVRRLLRLTPPRSQRLLFSATLDNDVDKLVREFMTDPVTHSTAAVAAAVDTMTHYQFHVGNRDIRNNVVTKIAARHGKTILFMRTKHGVDRQVKKLRRVGINAVGLHGDKGQNTRIAAMEAFSSGTVPVLVATDIAARGIDITDVDLVVHVDPPAEHKAYLHRAGRTARAGAQGRVVTLVTDEQITEVEKLLAKAGVTATTYKIHAQSPELMRITGARDASGSALAPFGASSPHPTHIPRTPRGRHGSAPRTAHSRKSTRRRSRGGIAVKPTHGKKK